MPAITVSPGYQGCLLLAAFHWREGRMPSDSPLRSIPVSRPKPPSMVDLARQW